MPLISDKEYKSYLKYKQYNVSYQEQSGSKLKKAILKLHPHQVIGVLILVIVFLLFLDALKDGDVTNEYTLTFLILIVVITYGIIQ